MSSEPSQLVSDLFNTYRALAPLIFVTWAFQLALPLLAAQFGATSGEADWFAAVVRPCGSAEEKAAEEAAKSLLYCAFANWIVDAALRKIVFPHKAIPWDFIVHHCFSGGLVGVVVYLGQGYGYMYLGLLAETYAFVVFASQLSFLKPAKKAKQEDFTRLDHIKSLAVHSKCQNSNPRAHQ